MEGQARVSQASTTGSAVAVLDGDCPCRGCKLGKNCYRRVEDHLEAAESTDPYRRFAGMAVKMVADVVDASAAGWYRLDRRGEPSGMIGYRRDHSLNSLAEAHSTYVLEASTDDPFRLPPTGRGRTREVTTTADLDGHAASGGFAKYLAAIGLPHRATLNLQVAGRFEAQLWAGRSDALGAFDLDSRRALRGIHAFIESVLNQNLVFYRSEMLADEDLERAGLTRREVEVASMAALGSSNEEISRELMISTATVKTHLYRVFDKLEIRSRTELAHRFRATR